MMKFLLLALLLTLSSCFNNDKSLTVEEKAVFNTQAKSKIALFKKTIRPKVKQGFLEGPEKAILVCSQESPRLIKEQSDQSNWLFRRVSLQTRGKHAQPDQWETKVLKQFDKRQANGESAKEMDYEEVVGNEYRYMKAQGTKVLCLACHGENMSSAMTKAIKKRYPNDKAVSYKKGKIRGAFSLSKII